MDIDLKFTFTFTLTLTLRVKIRNSFTNKYTWRKWQHLQRQLQDKNLRYSHPRDLGVPLTREQVRTNVPLDDKTTKL